MRTFAVLAASLLVGPLLAADDKKDEKIDAAKLVGKWKLTKAGGRPTGATVIRELTANGEMNEVVTLGKLTSSSKGTYKVDGSKLETVQKVLGSADVHTTRSDIVKLTDTVLHINLGEEVDEYERMKEEKKDK